jgi:hypothetical protein
MNALAPIGTLVVGNSDKRTGGERQVGLLLVTATDGPLLTLGITLVSNLEKDHKRRERNKFHCRHPWMPLLRQLIHTLRHLLQKLLSLLAR